MRTSRTLVCVVLGACVAVVSPVAAAEVADALSSARDLVRAFEYDAAMAQLESVLSDETAGASRRLQALELTALLQISLERQAQTQEAFERILNLDPGHELTDPELPPRAKALFAQTRESFLPTPSVDVEARTVSSTASGPLRLEATVSGRTEGVERVVAFVRGNGEEEYRRALMDRDDLRFSTDVSAALGGDGVEFYVEVQAPSGYVLATAGSAESPLRGSSTDEAGESGPDEGDEPVPPDRPRRWYRTWWFWTIVGVAVAGAVTATAVVLAQPEEQPAGSLGTLFLP